MKIFPITLLLVLIFGSAWAQTPQPKSNVRFKTYADIEKSADEIRSHEKQIRAFYTNMILRKAQIDIVTVLRNKQMSEEEIQKVVESPSMKHFLSKLEKHPSIRSKVDFYIQQLMRPGAIESHVMQRREMLAKEMQEQMNTALANLQSSKTYLTREEVHEPEDNRTLMTKLWDHLVDDLYKN